MKSNKVILNEHVKINTERFPKEFMFQLNKKEHDILTSQKRMDIIEKNKVITITDANNQVNSSNSLVLYTLTEDCLLNLFSPDQIAQFRLSATAKYKISLECGEISLALSSLSEKSSLETALILNLTSPIKMSKSVSEKPDLNLISFSCFSSSRNNKEGANNLILSENNISSFLVCLPLPSAIMAENSSLASITSFIYNSGNSDLSSLNIPIFTLSANPLASDSDNLLLSERDLNIAFCNAIDLVSCISNNLAARNLLTNPDQSNLDSSKSSLISSGISTINSAILIQVENEGSEYLKLSISNWKLKGGAV